MNKIITFCNRRIIFTAFFLFCITLEIFAVEQTRALWVTRWDYSSAEDIDRIVKNASLMNFNVILFQVRGDASAMYNSKLEPRSELLKDTNPNWNPLHTAIKSAHLADIQLHAWINLYPGWSGDNPPLDTKHIYYQHPDWFMHDLYGRQSQLKNGYQWLSPTHPEVTPYLLDVCEELYKNYEIDGLHLDYIRYPAASYSYDPTSVRAFQRKYGATPQERPTAWRRWRQNSISTLLDSLYIAAKKIKPELVISAAVVSNHDLGNKIYFQDSHDWLARGSVDAIYPMLYTNNTSIFARKLKEFVDNSHNRHVYAGISLEYNDLNGKLDAINEIGAQGVGIFSYKEITQNHAINKEIMTLLDSVWGEKATPNPMSWKGPIKDGQGPLITQVQTIPSPLPPNTDFKIAARILDESGVIEKSKRTGEQGIFLSTENSDDLKLQRIKKTKNWFITETLLPGQELGSLFQGRIAAQDNAHVSANHPRRNTGYSELLRMPVVKPDSSYIYAREIGPILWRPGDIAVDDLGHIWVTTEKHGPVFVMDSSGTMLDFSPLKTGENGFFESVWLDGIVGFARGTFNTMLVACNSEPPMIFRFDIETGESLPGIELSFRVGGITTDADGHIYALEKNTSRWYVLSQTGIELTGSPFGGRSSGGDIAVLSNGAAVFVSDSSENIIQTWHGAVEGSYSQYWNVDNLQENGIGAGNIFVDHQDRVFVSSSRFSHIAIYNRAGRPLGHIIDDKNLIAPLAMCKSNNGKYLYHIEVIGNGPTRVRQWLKKP